MNYKNIIIAGGGVLGSQIAMMCAYHGYNTKIWLRSEESIGRCKKKLDEVFNLIKEDIHKMCINNNKDTYCMALVTDNNFNEIDLLNKLDNAYKSISLTTSYDIFKECDLIIEAVSENIKAKEEFYQKIKEYLPENTIIVTNSSTLLPSKMAKFTGRPDKYLALHFANTIWKNNMVEVMMSKYTNNKYMDEISLFAKSIGMIPLKLYKEKNGYLLNSMLVPFLFSALDLYVKGISSYEDIDKAWTMGTHAPKGPFQILDIVGLKTAYEIVLNYTKVPSFVAPYDFKNIAILLKKYIDEGKLGKLSGEGFYKYDNLTDNKL